MAEIGERELFRQLGQHLRRVLHGGSNWLTLPPDTALAAELARNVRNRPPPTPHATAPAAQPPPQNAHPPRPAQRTTHPAPSTPAGPLASGTAPGQRASGAEAQGPARPVPAQPASPSPEAAPFSQPPVVRPAGPPPSTGSIATLESLRFQFRDCANCKLAPTRTRLVFGVGHDTPRIMFIGEGPGAEEDQQGLPFVGRAGMLLTGLITAMGLTREDVYITNVVKCRPPGNRNPEPDETAACRPILDRQIQLLHPQLIVTLGNVPLKTLRPDAGGITRERGQVFRHGEFQVLPTFHPSYLLRNPDALETCWEDLRLALQLAYPPS